VKKFAVRSLLLAALLAPALSLHAGDDTKTVVPADVCAQSCAKNDKIWSLEVGSGVQFSNVRESHLDGYTMVPANITLGLKLDDVSLDNFLGGYFRGYSEFLFQGFGYAITHGPESRIIGFNVGPRYNFVQPGWKVVPYVEGLVGLGFADSDPTVDGSGNPHGLGQDFNFTFGVGGGFRYDICENWFVRAGIDYTHFSNAGLSEPAHPNRAIDALGPQVSIGTRF
jgi:opacity protein-like surface antigen